MALAIEVSDVSKRFRLYHDKYTSLKERVIHMGKIPYEEFWALRNIGLEVEEGRTLGLLGRNGSGKSTLLKCIAGILQPTSGRIVIRGQVAAMLELGAGFHPELSGRDNIFLNASLLGMSRKEIESRFEEIVAFAELEQFIDNQVKYYSSGMYTRLGFAVAVNVDPEILLIDEVLAVGDEAFQRKCIERVRQFQREGRTIVFVSHAPDLVRQICDHAIVLHQGSIVAAGTPGEAIRSFREEMARYGETLEMTSTDDEVEQPVVVAGPSDTKPVQITSVEVMHPGSGSRSYLLPGEWLTVEVGYDALEPVNDAVFGISIHDSQGILVFGCDTEMLGHTIDTLTGRGRVTFRFDAIPLLDGTYALTLGVRSRDGGTVYDWREQQSHFEIMNPGKMVGSVALSPSVEVQTAPIEQGAAS